MGRTLLFEDSIQTSVNQLLANQKTQVGLMIGQLSTSKDFVVHFARCPDPVDNEVEIEMASSDDDVVVSKIENKEKIKKESKLADVIDTDGIDSKWIVEHARQVNRMLTGGMSVLGIYMFCSSDVLSANQSKLRTCLQAVQKKTEQSKWIRKAVPHNHRYIVHICASTRKVTCRTLDFHDDQASLQPAEYRYQPFLSNWNFVSSCVDVNVQFYVPNSQEAYRNEKKILYACQQEIEDIWNSYATTGHKLVDETKLLTDNSKLKKGKKEDREIKFVLFKKANSGGDKGYIQYNAANVQVKLVGSICTRTYLHPKSTYGDAVNALKVDIIRSLLTRIELLCEEAEVNNFCQVDEWSLMSPMRVFAPFKDGQIYFSDYIFKDESDEDTLSRFSELLNISLVKDDLEYPEKSPDVAEVSMILHGDKIADHHSDVASELSVLSSQDEPQNNRLVAAAFAGIAALFATAMHFFWSD